MKHFFHFTRLALAIFLLGLQQLTSEAAGGKQPPPGAKLIPQRNLAVCFLFAPSTPELYYKDANGEYQQLRIDTVRFDSWNTIPATGQLALYRKTEQAKDTSDPLSTQSASASTVPIKPKYEEVQVWTLPEGTESIRSLYYYSSEGKVKQQYLAATPTTHVAMQLRAINLLNFPAMVRAGEQLQQIAPGAEITVPATSAGVDTFIFQYGYRMPSGSAFASPPINLKFVIPTQRLTTIFGYAPVNDSVTGKIIGYEPSSARFYEDCARLPSVPEPAIITNQKHVSE